MSQMLSARCKQRRSESTTPRPRFRLKSGFTQIPNLPGKCLLHVSPPSAFWSDNFHWCTVFIPVGGKTNQKKRKETQLLRAAQDSNLERCRSRSKCQMLHFSTPNELISVSDHGPHSDTSYCLCIPLKRSKTAAGTM